MEDNDGNKFEKKATKNEKHLLLKVVGDALGVLVSQGMAQKNYSEVVTTNFLQN